MLKENILLIIMINIILQIDKLFNRIDKIYNIL